jgi:hypothetical protein
MIILVVVSEETRMRGKMQESREMRTGSANNFTSSEENQTEEGEASGRIN